MGLFRSKQRIMAPSWPIRFEYRVTCAFLEWKLLLEFFPEKEAVVSYQWVSGQRNKYSTVILENSIRRMCNNHGLKVSVGVKELFPDWDGDPSLEPGIEYKTDGYLMADFFPSLHEGVI
jgi:hypothetical protein